MYQYSRLDPLRKEIRLLRVWSLEECQQKSSSNKIQCSMLTASLLESPAYQALSYTWGDMKLDKSIVIDAEEFLVTENLASAMLNIRKEAEQTIIWIDAVSIAQNDKDEKSWQVALMGEIYKYATEVLVWLGPAADDSDMAMDAMSMIGPYAAKLSETYKEDLDQIAKKCLESHSSELESLDEKSPEYLYHRLIGSFGKEWQFPLPAMKALVRRTWWRRTWVLQELVLARHVFFLCGSKKLEERSLMGAWSALALLNETIYQKLFVNMKEVSEYEMSFPKEMLDDSARKILQYRRRINPLYKECLSLSLLGLLRLTAIGRAGRKEPNFAVTDPRDRVFGLLGLAADTDTLDIKPYYNAKESEVYTSVAFQLLKNGHMSVLDLTQFPKQVTSLPSWVADWSCPIEEPLQLYQGNWYTGDGPIFNASGSSVQLLRIQIVA